MEKELLVFVLVALVALAGMAVVAPGSALTGAVSVSGNYAGLSKRLCPDPLKPVPVIVQRADLPGTTGKSQVTCMPAGTIVSAYGRTFFPEYNRKASRFAYGSEKLREI